MSKKFLIDIYTDGACSGNPGVGGWGVVITLGDFFKEFSGAEPQTTNNRMELMAVIMGLKALSKPCEVNVYSDSAYVVNAFNEGWLSSWQKRGWRNANDEKVKNKEMWQELVALTQKHTVTFIKVKGHADNDLNNRCDYLATTAIKDYIAQHPELNDKADEGDKNKSKPKKISKKAFDKLVNI